MKDSHEKENLARSKRILGVWYNEDLRTYHNYEAFVPADFDANTLTKKYPVFLEVYAGPEFQKISGSWKGSWPQVHLPGAYDCITCKCVTFLSRFLYTIYIISKEQIFIILF